MNNETAQHTFRGLGIAPGILDALDRMKFKVPTPIQFKAIPIAIEGKDVMGIAQTGTGKTMAFGIPMVQRLASGPGKGIVMVPTRELALQVDEAIRKISQPFNIRTVVLIGGTNINPQIQALRKDGARILIATPGRLLDHIQQRTANLSDVKFVVLDEADRMLDMGFAPQIQRIFPHIPKDRQTNLYSATMPPEIMHMATSYMKLPIQVEVARSGTVAENVTHELFIVRKESKRQLLSVILKQYHGSVLIFARTRFDALRLTKAIREMNHTVAEIHSDRSLGQRREALEGFKTGRYRVLVATDIASRGIDVKEIELVINYELPDESENYVHRIGRTGRAGHEGRAISLVTPDQRNQVRAIELLLRAPLKVSTHPEFPTEGFDKPVVIARSFRGGRRGRSMGPKRYVR